MQWNPHQCIKQIIMARPFSTKSSASRSTSRIGKGNSISGVAQETKGPTNRFSRYVQTPARSHIGRNPAGSTHLLNRGPGVHGKKGTSSDNKNTSLASENNVLTARKSSAMIAPKGYTARPIIPASKPELLPVARAMNRDDFAPRLKRLFDPERQAALEAIESGVYIGWRCPEFKHDCIRVGKDARCFCGHKLSEHSRYHGNSVRVPCHAGACKCKAFAFVPSRAEDVGEWWLPRRVGYDAGAWRAKCKCKHTHEEHAPNGARKCRVIRCPCASFRSSFLCCACDRHWEVHETVFESAETRRQKGIPYGQHYLPFHEMPELRNVVLTGREDDSSMYDELTQGPYAIPENKPSALSLQLLKNSEKQPR